jgi:hypothetical protein
MSYGLLQFYSPSHLNLPYFLKVRRKQSKNHINWFYRDFFKIFVEIKIDEQSATFEICAHIVFFMPERKELCVYSIY